MSEANTPQSEEQNDTAAWRVAHPQQHPAFNAFVATISALRAPDGCPWDKEQTHQSIAHNMIEEAYEAVDAIEANDVAHMREELGDVLLQVVLQSQIAADAGLFTIDEVCAEVNEKIIRRHPHVFGESPLQESEAQDAGAVLNLWDKVKLAEKEAADEQAQAQGKEREGLLDGVPTAFPALMQAQKISRKAVAAGFEWDSLDAVWQQTEEEMEELKAAYAAAPKGASGKVSENGELPTPSEADPKKLVEAVELEFGDVLFSLVNVARKMGIDSEDALRTTCRKFRQRWSFMEHAAWEQGRSIEELSTEEQEQLWQRAKAARL